MLSVVCGLTNICQYTETLAGEPNLHAIRQNEVGVQVTFFILYR